MAGIGPFATPPLNYWLATRKTSKPSRLFGYPRGITGGTIRSQAVCR